jgi:hypothetical protein
MNVFDKIIQLIYLKRNGSAGRQLVINKNSKKIKKIMPRIYYIGYGKTGSRSLKEGFPTENTAHWHTVLYFEHIYGTKLLSKNNYDLYDLILYIGKKYNFKPILIEAIRNYIDLNLSCIFHNIKKNKGKKNRYELPKKNKIDTIRKSMIEILKNDKKPYSVSMYKKHFNIDLFNEFNIYKNYYYNETDTCHLLFLKFEDIKNWQKIINKVLPFKFKLKHANKNNDTLYNKCKNKIKYTKNELKILENETHKCFYTKKEIDLIYKKKLK